MLTAILVGIIVVLALAWSDHDYQQQPKGGDGLGFSFPYYGGYPWWIELGSILFGLFLFGSVVYFVVQMLSN